MEPTDVMFYFVIYVPGSGPDPGEGQWGSVVLDA
jgi:hypothetical protein